MLSTGAEVVVIALCVSTTKTSFFIQVHGTRCVESKTSCDSLSENHGCLRLFHGGTCASLDHASFSSIHVTQSGRRKSEATIILNTQLGLVSEIHSRILISAIVIITTRFLRAHRRGISDRIKVTTPHCLEEVCFFLLFSLWDVVGAESCKAHLISKFNGKFTLDLVTQFLLSNHLLLESCIFILGKSCFPAVLFIGLYRILSTTNLL